MLAKTQKAKTKDSKLSGVETVERSEVVLLISATVDKLHFTA